MIGFFLADELARVRRNQPGRRRIWLRHALAVIAVVAWVTVVCGMPLWLYFLGFVYLAGALTRIRSFAEHRFAERHEERTAIVEHGGLLGLLYLKYDAGGGATAALWDDLRARLDADGIADVPQDLTVPADYEAAWLDADLLLSQTCGYR
jgi:hypothetical protein